MIDWEAAKRRAAEMDRKLGRGSGGGNPPPASPPVAKLDSSPRPLLRGSDVGTETRDWGGVLKAPLLPTANWGLYGAGDEGRTPQTSFAGALPSIGEPRGGANGLPGHQAPQETRKAPDYTAMLRGGKVSHYGATAFDAQAETVERAAARMKEIEKQIEDTYAEAARNGEITGPGVMELERERKGIETRYPSLKRPGFLPWLGKNVEAGWQGVGSGLAATYDFLTGGKVGFISDANRELRTASQETTRLADEMSEAKGGLYPVAGKLTQGTVSALPNAALALATGGASVPAQLGAQSAGLGATLSTAVTTLAKNPGFWMANAQTLGNSYESAKAGGANEMEATATALLNSLLSSAVEVGGGIETLPAALARDTSEAGVKMWVRSMLEEGGEEVVQGVIENLTQKAMYDSDKPVFSMRDESAVINPVRMAGEFAMGAAVGGILGGGQMGAQKVAGLLPGAVGGGKGNPSVSAEPSQLPWVGEPSPAGDGGQQKTAPGMGAEYRAKKPQNVELPTVPIINLSMNEVAALNGGKVPESGGYVRKDAVARAVERLGLNQSGAAYVEASNVTRNGDAYVLKITKDSLNKMLSATSYPDRIVPPESIAIIENLERIANNGVYYQSDGDRQGRDQIAGFDHLMTTVYIDNAPYVVDMRVRVYTEKAGGENRLYHFTPEAVTVTKRRDDGLPLGHATRTYHLKAGEPSSSDTTLPQGYSGVKIEDMQDGGEYVPRGLLTGREAADGAVRPEHMTDAQWAAWQNRKDVSGSGTYRGTPATDKLGIKVERPITDLGMSQSLRGMEKSRYEAGQALNRLLKDSNATKAELTFARGVADGTYTAKQVLPGLNMDLVEEIADAIRLEQSFGKNGIREKKDRTNWDYDAKVQELIKDSDSKHAPSVISMNANTMQRNNERVWGDDAKAINEELFDPVIANEAERIRFVNRTLEKMEKYKLNGKESALVQRLMEGDITEGQLNADGHDAARLAAAAKTLTGVYSDFYEAINDFLVSHGYKEIGFQKNYAPHMQAQETGTLQKYLRRLGFQTEVTELPTEIAGRTDAFRPGKQYDPYFQHRVGDKVDYDAVGGLESYVNYLSNVFYHTDDIQKLRRFNEALRVKYSSEELGAELDRLNHLEDRPAADDDWEAQGIQDRKDAAFTRYGNMSRFGTYVSVLDDYTNILAGKQSKLDRSVESFLGRKALNIGRNIQNAFSKAAILGNLSSAVNQTVQLPQLIAEMGPGYVTRAVADVATGATGKTGFNQESDFLTGKTGIQSISEKSGTERVFDIAAKPFEVVDDFASRVIVRAKYLEQVAKGKSHSEALKTADKFATRLVGSRMKGAKPVFFEQKNPLSRLVTTFQLEVANGWQHIVHDLPMEIQQLAKTEGKGAAAKRTAQLVIASQIVNFIANIIIKGITGREPVPFDGLGMLVNYLASGYGMTKEAYMESAVDGAAEAVTGGRPLGTAQPSGSFELPKALQTAGEGIMENIPYASNITTMLGMTDGRLPLPQVWNSQLSKAAGNIGKAFTAEDEQERADALSQAIPGAVHGLATAGATWIPMGSQIKKTAQGTGVLLRGGDYAGYGDKETLKYDIEQTPANIARGFLFGKSALPETDAFYATGSKPLSEAQTEVYKNLMEGGTSGKDAYQTIQEVRKAKKTDEDSQTMERVRVLENSSLSLLQQAEVYRGMLASDSELELIAVLDKLNAAPEKAYQTLVAIRRATDSETGKTDSNLKRTAIINSGLTDEQKVAVYQNRVSAERDDDIAAVLGTGLEFDDFLEAQNEYNALYNQKGSASEKGTDFAHWMNGQGYTDVQRDAVRKVFKFYSQIPNDETIYERFVGAGVDNDTAYDLAGRLSALNPELGKNQVPTLQKSRVIVDSGMDDAHKVAALGEVMSEGENLKLSTAYQYSVPPDAYVSYLERLRQVDANGSVTQEEARRAIDGLKLSMEQKAVLWQLQNISWKPYKNPYSQGVSGQVLAAYQSGKTQAAAEGPKGLLTGAQAARETTGLPKLGTQRELPELRSGPKGLLTGRQAAGQ